MSPREAYRRALYHLGKRDKRIVRFDADLRSSLKGDYFYTHFPERCFKAGIAEMTMELLSCAFGREGMIPLVTGVPIMTLEPHNIIGGLGSAVAEVVSSKHPQLIERFGIGDHFTKSGRVSDLTAAYHIGVDDIVERARTLLKRAETT